VLHYCGHAFFTGTGLNASGLVLPDKHFTAEDLEAIPTLPRVAFVNACKAGRVRGDVDNKAAAFAELFLSSGVEAYIGTFWAVLDTAATKFATDVYSRLTAGLSLADAVLQSRKALLDAGVPDWANYILYGDGAFRLVAT
jgi:CHAT domain-containing protein